MTSTNGNKDKKEPSPAQTDELASDEAGVPPEDASNAEKPTEESAEEPTEEPAANGSSDPGSAPASPSPDGSDSANPSPDGSGSDSTRDAEQPVRQSQRAAGSPEVPEVHSGRKLARRYRLEECITRLDGFSSWRAVDEKLRRAVGIHVLPVTHPRARSVLGAARSAALLGDPRFVQVLDAVEEGELVYVVHEWLPDAVPLTTLLQAGPLVPYDAYQLVSQLSQAMAAAHREGLAHLRLNPGAVLRTSSGQYRIRGLAVTAALRGITVDQPQRVDTEATGALLYAALTQRWPHEEDAYGLSGVPGLAKGTLIPPDQVRAGVHRGLSELAMRALVNDGATASREDQPCSTPESLAKAVVALPRIPPPETTFSGDDGFRSAVFQRNGYGATPSAAPLASTPAPAPPALPGRTGRALKWGVSALLIAALGLGSWQLADTLLKGDNSESGSQSESDQQRNTPSGVPAGQSIPIVAAKDFDPYSNGEENSKDVAAAHDDDPASSWHTQNYYGRADFGGLKRGVGLILDLGKQQQVGSVKVNFLGSTSAELLVAPAGDQAMPTTFESFRKVADGTGSDLTLQPKQAASTQYVLVWLTELPADGSGYRGRIADIKVSS